MSVWSRHCPHCLLGRLHTRIDWRHLTRQVWCDNASSHYECGYYTRRRLLTGHDLTEKP